MEGFMPNVYSANNYPSDREAKRIECVKLLYMEGILKKGHFPVKLSEGQLEELDPWMSVGIARLNTLISSRMRSWEVDVIRDVAKLPMEAHSEGGFKLATGQRWVDFYDILKGAHDWRDRQQPGFGNAYGQPPKHAVGAARAGEFAPDGTMQPPQVQESVEARLLSGLLAAGYGREDAAKHPSSLNPGDVQARSWRRAPLIDPNTGAAQAVPRQDLVAHFTATAVKAAGSQTPYESLEAYYDRIAKRCEQIREVKRGQYERKKLQRAKEWDAYVQKAYERTPAGIKAEFSKEFITTYPMGEVEEAEAYRKRLQSKFDHERDAPQVSIAQKNARAYRKMKGQEGEQLLVGGAHRQALALNPASVSAAGNTAAQYPPGAEVGPVSASRPPSPMSGSQNPNRVSQKR